MTMQLEETNPAYSITVIIGVILALISEPIEGNADTCHAYYNFHTDGPFEDVDSQGIKWTTNPSVSGTEPCQKKGVISMIPPNWAGSAEITLTFSTDPSGWVFNLGDSPHNNGYGGDGSQTYSTEYDAEIYAQGKALSVYPNENGARSEQVRNRQNAFNSWLTLKIQASGLAAYSDTNIEYNSSSPNLLAFGDSVQAHERFWYLGVNRIVNPYDQTEAESGKEGSGLCSVCIRWVQGQNLEPPAQPPVLPDGGTPGGTPAPVQPAKGCLETGTCKVCYNFDQVDHNSYTNNAESGVEWTVFPDDRDKPCSARSVMKLTPPINAKEAQISFTFTDSRNGWLLNLGDSPFNNGYGKGGTNHGDNAEITASGRSLEVYKNTFLGETDLRLFRNGTAFNRWLVLKVRDRGMAAFSDSGLFYKEYNNYLLRLNTANPWFLGLNRIIETFDDTAVIGERYGDGLCSVCIDWNTDGNLERPSTNPVQPPPAPPGQTITTTTEKNVDNSNGENNVPANGEATQSNKPAILGPGPNSSSPVSTPITLVLSILPLIIVNLL